MLKASDMKRIARIDAGLFFEPGFEGKVADFAREFALQRIELPGGTAVAEGCYERAKSRLAAARPGSARQGTRIRSLKSWLEPIQAICRMTRKKILGE